MQKSYLVLVIKKTQNHPKADPEKRSIFCKKIQEFKAANKTIIYIDESGFAHHMPRTHGYSKRGLRCFGLHDWGARGRTNAIGALVDKKLLTVSLFEQNINANIFSSWVRQDLLPKLPPKSVIVMDNATFHKNKEMQKEIINTGHILEYLPPYSPDLNPIEHKWASAKKIRRSTGCSIDTLFNLYVA